MTRVLLSLLAAFLLALLAAFLLGLALGLTVRSARADAPSAPRPPSSFEPFPAASAEAGTGAPPSGGTLGAGTPATVGRLEGAPTPSPALPTDSLRPGATARVGAPVPATTLRGTASWFAAPVGTAAAGPALRAALGPDWRGRSVAVTSGGMSVRVVLDDWCQCYGTRLIDLSLGSFSALADPSRGLVLVEVTGG